MPSLRKMLQGRKGGPVDQTDRESHHQVDQEDRDSLHQVVQSLTHDTRVARVSTQSTVLRLMVDSFIPSFLSYIACTLMDTSPSFSILLFPLLQLGVEKVSKPLKSLFARKSTDNQLMGSTPTPETVEQLTVLVKQLVMDQHRTMFYTVTLSTTPPLPTSIPKRRTEHLKWQFASSVCKSQAVIKRSNTNCPTYYSITFMGEMMEEDEETIR